MLSILVVIGTRPEAIKLVPVIRALEERPDRVRTRVCVTAQHRGMLDDVLARCGIEAHHDLDIMVRHQTPSEVAAAVLRGMEPILAAERPDWVVVQGDTTSVAAAALAGAYAACPVAHVEAGLRTGDPLRPFPEETNRRLVAQLAARHFAPTSTARANLLAEGVPARDILVTGNTVIDALDEIVAGLPEMRIAGGDERLVLVTAHRRENLGAPLEEVCAALRELSSRAPDLKFVVPLHPRPDVAEVVAERLSDLAAFDLRGPLEHPELVDLMRRAALVITDSGGLQEEAPALGAPVVVLREVTERPEAVDAGLARLVGTDRGAIVATALEMLESGREPVPARIYGDGRAAGRIAASLAGEPVVEWTDRVPALEN